MNNTNASPGFSSAHSLAWLLITFLAIYVLITLMAIPIGYHQLTLLSNALTDQTGVPQIIGTLQLAAHLTVCVVFLIWFYRAHRNLRALGIRGGRYSSPWSILLFFVPILNLYYSYDLVKELWRQSSPDLGFSDDFLKQHELTFAQYPSKTALIDVWWGFTIASFFVARASSTIISSSRTISDLTQGAWFYMASDVLDIVGSIVLIVIVKEIDARQEEKHRRLTLQAPAQKADKLSSATEFVFIE
jgi:hypothetical protein